MLSVTVPLVVILMTDAMTALIVVFAVAVAADAATGARATTTPPLPLQMLNEP